MGARGRQADRIAALPGGEVEELELMRGQAQGWNRAGLGGAGAAQEHGAARAIGVPAGSPLGNVSNDDETADGSRDGVRITTSDASPVRESKQTGIHTSR